MTRGEHGEDLEKLVAPADFDGPTKDRKCTDTICLLLIVAAWVVMTAVGAYSLANGDYRLILFPLDYAGNICGTDYDADMTDYPFLLYVNAYSGGVCVKECPDLGNATEDGATDVHTLITYGGIWQTEGAELAPDFVEVADYSNVSDAAFCTQENCFPDPNVPSTSWKSDGVNRGLGYAFYASSTYWALWRCYITDKAEEQLETQLNATNVLSIGDAGAELLGLDAVDDAYQFWNRLYADLWAAQKFIFGIGFGGSLLISIVYIFLLRVPVLLTTIVWTSILASIALFFVGGYYAWTTASDWKDEEPQRVQDRTINITTGVSIALWIIGAVLLLLACCLRKSIQLAVLCVKEAGRAVNSMILILLVPVLQAVGLIIFVAVFCVYAVHLASLGEIKTTEYSVPSGQGVTLRTYKFDDFVENCAWYLLFCLFWTANFIVAIGDMIVSVAVAKWYFTRNKVTVGSWTVLSSVRDVLRYHLGTCAYGSLILAIIQLIRAILARLQKKAKETKNKVLEYLLCCCQCCFWCLEKCIKFINKNAYIQTAIFSTSFCKSCRASFSLIFRNAARVGAVTYVSAAVLIIGKLFISAATTAMAYVVLNEEMNDELYSVAGPVAVIFLISYWVSDFFMDVFEMGITTVLHCFVADEEMFDRSNCYAENSLRRYIDRYGSGKD